MDKKPKTAKSASVNEASDLDTDDDMKDLANNKGKNKLNKKRSSEEKVKTAGSDEDQSQEEQIEIDYSNASMPPGDVKDWDINDVQKWLMYISTRRPKQMSKDKPIIPFFQLYFRMFYARQVNGVKLIEQTSNTLANDLLIKNAHRSILLAFIDELRDDKKKLKKKIKLWNLLNIKIKELVKLRNAKQGQEMLVKWWIMKFQTMVWKITLKVL